MPAPPIWNRATRAADAEAQRVARLSDHELSGEQGRAADREREQRALERSCEHASFRRLGRSEMVRCSTCGATRSPPVHQEPAPAMPSTPAPRATVGGFPAGPVRDLLGVVRAMRAAALERGAGARDLAHHDGVIWELETAFARAAEAPPGSAAEEAATERAERAARRVADLVRLIDSAGDLVRAAARRVGARR